MLIVGAQLALWAISGAYFAFMDIDFIHGDSLIKREESYLKGDKSRFPIGSLYSRYPGTESVRLQLVAGQEVYRIIQHGETRLIHPVSGQPLPPIEREQAIAIAQYHYAGAGPVSHASLLTDVAPSELSPRHLPSWRVDFDDFGNTSLYLSADEGALVAKRHDFWRWFDIFWYIHIMDYDDGANINNWLLRIAALLAMLGASTGLILTWRRFVPGKETSQ
ncbi:hypothetical protein GCM10025772_25420 [Ferrimonas gelatinilytica]|uniref:PepSY domain-containing protein n=2 Tax=Ferrimonas gelatinilytica TaxID=1255257 RepID=A0ABP9SDQ7_9GAMM